jgi:hypothetical protein
VAAKPSDLFWGEIRAMREQMQAHAKSGNEARVTIYLRSGESFEPGIVRRDDPYVMFQTTDKNSEVRVIVTPQNEIEKIDISYRPSGGKTIGFNVAQTSDEVLPDNT